MKALTLPPNLVDAFTPYGPQQTYGPKWHDPPYDNCKEFGWRPLRQLSESEWSEASKYGYWYCAGPSKWVLLEQGHPEQDRMSYHQITRLEK